TTSSIKLKDSERLFSISSLTSEAQVSPEEASQIFPDIKPPPPAAPSAVPHKKALSTAALRKQAQHRDLPSTTLQLPSGSLLAALTDSAVVAPSPRKGRPPKNLKLQEAALKLPSTTIPR
ncbi:MAG: hypothetical protein Q8P67_18845, partial [archaeon]|nr:hypothetical protein [archaeon]